MIAANITLRCLQSPRVPGIRRSPDTSPIYFHVNDPSELTQEQQGEASTGKPDLVLVSADDVHSSRGLLLEEVFHRPEDLLLKVAPESSFNLSVVRTFLQCTTSKKQTIAGVDQQTKYPESKNTISHSG